MQKGLELDPGRIDLLDEMGTLIVRQVSLQAAAASGANTPPVMEEKIGGGTGPKSATSPSPNPDSGANANKADATPAAPHVTLKDAHKDYPEARSIITNCAPAQQHHGVLQYQDKNLEEAVPHL